MAYEVSYWIAEAMPAHRTEHTEIEGRPIQRGEAVMVKVTPHLHDVRKRQCHHGVGEQVDEEPRFAAHGATGDTHGCERDHDEQHRGEGGQQN